MNAETRTRVEELVAEAPPLTPEQITAAVAILARPPESASIAARARRARSTPSTETRRAAA